MAQSRFSRRLGFLVILAALSFSMVLPAFALFDQDDTARGDQSLPIAENFSLTTYRPDGTAFQRRVWQSLCDIPYGRVISYRELAAQVGSPRAFQAVGQANGRNPLPILIPCHRVIAADGTLGGYSSGVERKRFLLRLEGLSIPESKPPRRVGKRGVRAR